MISVKDISKSFGNINVLKDVSIDLQEGKVNMIIGKSGAGKSVLLKWDFFSSYLQNLK